MYRSLFKDSGEKTGYVCEQNEYTLSANTHLLLSVFCMSDQTSYRLMDL
jgi:hypothetical protein